MNDYRNPINDTMYFGHHTYHTAYCEELFGVWKASYLKSYTRLNVTWSIWLNNRLSQNYKYGMWQL